MAKRAETAQTAQQKRRAKLLEHLRSGVTITRACLLAAVPRRTAYDWREQDQDFAAAWDDALEQGTDVMEDECFRRAVEGVEKPTGFYMGKPSAYVREYSDTLLIFMLKARRPEKFRDRLETVNRNFTTPIDMHDEDMEILKRFYGSRQPAAGSDESGGGR